uniref:Uncharacterized protein n=1 Tax=Wuchereria bancrofti TaxID=6293 RepID=A0A1I8EIZ1_WUCBA
MSSLIQTQSSKILSTTRGSCHARHVSLHHLPKYVVHAIHIAINRACFRGGWSGITPAERFFGAFFAIRLIGRSCREEGAVVRIIWMDGWVISEPLVHSGSASPLGSDSG